MIVAQSIIQSNQYHAQQGTTWLQKLFIHMNSFWNWLDCALAISFVLGVVLRVQSYRYNDQAVKVGAINIADPDIQVMYSIGLLLQYLRIMQMFYMSKTLGPKIIMIQRMVEFLLKLLSIFWQLKDVLFFLIILVIFILAFGIAMQALLHPNENFSYETLKGAVYLPYFQVFGELFLDRVEGLLIF